MRTYWVSCPAFTFRVEVNDKGVITDSAPVGRRFIGQTMYNLGSWLAKFGDYRMEEL